MELIFWGDPVAVDITEEERGGEELWEKRTTEEGSR